MRKLIFLAGLFLLTKLAVAQQRLTVLTQTTNGTDKIQTRYKSNLNGDSLVVNNSTTFLLSVAAKNAYLIINADTLRLDFNDASLVLGVNEDRYQLYPEYYRQLKQKVMIKHSVMAILMLLEDGIGDCQIEEALPLMLFTPQIAKHVQSATITTQRTQADMKDIWHCVYHYNGNGKLDSVSAASDEETRFSKKIVYKRGKISSIKTFRNIEDRQVSSRTISYADPSTLRWKEVVEETGKNRETELNVKLQRTIE